MPRPIDEIWLEQGSHPNADKGLCAMEAVAWLAGESHRDDPVCVCSALTLFVQAYNDTASGAVRQQLKRLLPYMIGTCYDGLEEERMDQCTSPRTAAMRGDVSAVIRAIDPRGTHRDELWEAVGHRESVPA